MNKLLSLFLLSLITVSVSAQTYRSPVGFDLALAGNVGEIRIGHFHTGIDIKALQGVGSAVYAVADGYVSRIGIAPSGYGNFMMVTHANGRSSLYAHLDSFAPRYMAFVEAEQLRCKNYPIDVYIPAGRFPVKAGDRIASLGNSGASGGPHLHFEIRDTGSSPLNILANGTYHVSDNVPPTIFKIHLYECDTIMGVPYFSCNQTIEYVLNKQGEQLPTHTVMQISKPSYLAYEVIDYKDGRTNTMGVYSLTQSIDGVRNFGFKIDRISFANTRYVNALTQYDLNSKTPYHVLRAYKAPNNKLDIYQNVIRRGVIMPPAIGQQMAVQTVATDDNGNKTTVNFTLQGAEKSTQTPFTPLPNHKIVFWALPFLYNDENIKVEMSASTLYESSFVEIAKKGDLYSVGATEIPLQSNISITLKEDVPERLRPKALLVSVSDKGTISAIGGGWSGAGVTAKTRNFGKFKIMYDTIQPQITPVTKPTDVARTLRIDYKISDNLSGIAAYNVFVDNKWTVAAYDPKSRSLTVRVKKSQTPLLHNVLVRVSDRKNNTTTLEQKIKW